MDHDLHGISRDCTTLAEDRFVIVFEDGNLSAESLGHIRTFIRRVARPLAPNGRYPEFDADDVEQGSIINALAGICELRSSEPGRVKAWLRIITQRVFLDILRDRKANAKYESHEDGDERNKDKVESSLGSPELTHKTILLSELMAELDEREQRLVVWRHVEGRTIENIVKMSGMTTSAVKYALDQASQKMTRKGMKRK